MGRSNGQINNVMFKGINLKLSLNYWIHQQVSN